MVRKKIGKQRLDKYYHLAKEHGYRARSAFKLLQLNTKYNFLEDCEILIDLCAAPGGWLQVAAKEMKNKRQIIGIDLSTIKPLKDTITMQLDITSDECIKELSNTLEGEADVVLHDGAPNVGSEWSKDAFGQNELVLHSLRLASMFLKKDGVFVTKIFRSKDYCSLLWVFNQLFENTIATKPLSSRDESAEIFVVCKGYKKPDTIDQSFFDPAKVFEDTKQEKNVSELYKGKGKDGYEDLNFYKCLDFTDFLASQELLKTLLQVSKVVIDKKYEKYFSNETLCVLSDLKVAHLNDMKKVVKKRDRFIELMQNNTEDENLIELNKMIGFANIQEEHVEDKIDESDWKLQHIKQEIKKQHKKEKKSEQKELIKKANAKIFKLPDNKFFDDKIFTNNLHDENVKVTDVAGRQNITRQENSEDYESEDFEIDQNEIKAIAKYKENKEDFIMDTVDKHVMGEENLPEWFLKEEREYNARLLDESSEFVDKKTRKKENEAILRRMKKAKRKVDSLLKKNGNNASDQNEEEETKKKNLMRNAFRKTKMKPLLVFPRNGKIAIPKTKRKIKLVDRRMKKEIRAERRREKRKK